MDYTLITGATGVLGKNFAEECASRGCRLLLTARNRDKLNRLKSYLAERYSAEVEVFPCDLADSGQRQAFYSFAQHVKIERLINVAGADIQKAFEKYDEQKLTFQIRANFEGAVSMCRFALLNRAEHLEIINISSVSGIYPMPYFAVYSASKRALTQFSVALREEVKHENVKVCAVLPGAVYTRKDVVENIQTQGLWGKLAAKRPAFVVEKSLKAVRRNKAVFIPGFCNKCMNAVTKLLPLKLKLKFIASKWSKTEKDAF